MSWQPIESAPKDGTSFLCNDSPFAEEVMCICLWAKGLFGTNDGEWISSCNREGFPVNPTQWMPLPEPPKADE